MKIFLFSFLIFGSCGAFGGVFDVSKGPAYLGAPILGFSSSSLSSGGSRRDFRAYEGAEFFAIRGRWAAGLVFNVLPTPEEGTKAVNVAQEAYSLTAEGRFRIWDVNFGPYVLGGLGGLSQTVVTRLSGRAEQVTGYHFLHDYGLGLWGLLSSSVSLNFGAKYYEYAAVNGFNYFLSLGFLL